MSHPIRTLAIAASLATPLMLSAAGPPARAQAVSGIAKGSPLALATVSYRADARMKSVTYRPGHASSYHSDAPPTPVQLHGGFFDPAGDGATAYEFGLRSGPQMTPALQIGGMVDWIHRSDSNRMVVGDPYTQGGQTVTPERVLSKATSDVIPAMAFMQLNLGNGPLVPYAGIGGGYEWLLLSAQDYDTGLDYNATFGGWGWQAWAGVGLTVGKSVRLVGEVYSNQSDVERDVADPNGVTYSERVNLDGTGMRFGINFGF